MAYLQVAVTYSFLDDREQRVEGSVNSMKTAVFSNGTTSTYCCSWNAAASVYTNLRPRSLRHAPWYAWRRSVQRHAACHAASPSARRGRSQCSLCIVMGADQVVCAC